MLVLSVGVHQSEDICHFLDSGHEVVIFEANRYIFARICTRFAAAIDEGRLHVFYRVIGLSNEENFDFFIKNEDIDIGSFSVSRMDGPQSDYQAFKVPSMLFETAIEIFGRPDYFQCNMNECNIFVAKQLANLSQKPMCSTFKTIDLEISKQLVLAGYRSFSISDGYPADVICAASSDKAFQMGRIADGNKILSSNVRYSFESMMYVLFRYGCDPFGSSNYSDQNIHVYALFDEPDTYNDQLSSMKFAIVERFKGRCGMRGNLTKPLCPFSRVQILLKESGVDFNLLDEESLRKMSHLLGDAAAGVSIRDARISSLVQVIGQLDKFGHRLAKLIGQVEQKNNAMRVENDSLRAMLIGPDNGG